MMHPNEKVLRAALDAIASGDRDAVARMIAEDVLIHVPGRGPLSGELRGRGRSASG